MIPKGSQVLYNSRYREVLHACISMIRTRVIHPPCLDVWYQKGHTCDIIHDTGRFYMHKSDLVPPIRCIGMIPKGSQVWYNSLYREVFHAQEWFRPPCLKFSMHKSDFVPPVFMSEVLHAQEWSHPPCLDVPFFSIVKKVWYNSRYREVLHAQEWSHPPCLDVPFFSIVKM